MNGFIDPESRNTGLSVAVFKILKSLARFTLRRGMSVAAISELVRRAYLSAAVEIIAEEGAKETTTRICAMTGLYRREIRRLETLPPLTDEKTNDKLNRSTRVVSGWLRDPDFQTKTGRPAALALEGEHGFDMLVRKYSGDITPTAIRQELERLDIISFTKGGLIKLKTRVYLNASDDDGLNFLGGDTSDLIETISFNLDEKNDEKLFQRKVAYVNVPEDKVEEFRQFADEHCQDLLVKLDHWLANIDNDSEEDTKYRLGVGIYHFRTEQSVVIANEEDITGGSQDNPNTADPS